MSYKSLVYLSYGKGVEQIAETKYSILSALRWLQHEKNIKIILYTDFAAAYTDLPVIVRSVTPAELSAWQGPFKYTHRRKAEVILDAVQSAGGPVIFIDSDTWFKRSPQSIFDKVSPGRTVMHIKEGYLGQSSQLYNKSLAEHISKANYKFLDGTLIESGAGIMVWNSGVVGIHPDDSHLIENAIFLIDQIWPNHPNNRTLEQVAMSVSIGFVNRLSPASDTVFHYWAERERKPFHAKAVAKLEETEHMPVYERAEVLHSIRPRLVGINAVKHRAKCLVRSLGVSWPNSVPGSAS